MKNKTKFSPIGHSVPGKTDMERMGIFAELGYITDHYIPSHKILFSRSAFGGRQMLGEGPKTRSGLQSGYFQQTFDRIMTGEAFSDRVKMSRVQRAKNLEKNLGKAFMPSRGHVDPNGLGTHYGTFSGPIQAFSYVCKAKQPFKPTPKNCLVSPPKKGTGYGYPNVCIGEDYPYGHDEYPTDWKIYMNEYKEHKKKRKFGPLRLGTHPQGQFDPNPYEPKHPLPLRKEKKGRAPKLVQKPFLPPSKPKKMGNMKAGTFDPFPQYTGDPYKMLKRWDKNVVNKTGTVYLPLSGPKSHPISSIVNYNLHRSMNVNNYKTFVPTAYAN